MYVCVYKCVCVCVYVMCVCIYIYVYVCVYIAERIKLERERRYQQDLRDAKAGNFEDFKKMNFIYQSGALCLSHHHCIGVTHTNTHFVHLY